MRPFVPAVLALMLTAAACGGGSESGSSTTDAPPPAATEAPAEPQATTGAPAPTTTAAPAPTTTAAPAPTTTAAPAAVFVSTPITLTEVVPDDPDPLETILPLTGVSVTTTAAGELGFTLPNQEFGDLVVRLLGVGEGQFIICSTFLDGTLTTQCFAQTPDGFFLEDADVPAEFPGFTAWVPKIAVTSDSISIEIDGVTYTGTGLQIEDGPVMVAINPDGSLQNEVTRRSGEISAAELFTALGG